jgi:hypothetical protein
VATEICWKGTHRRHDQMRQDEGGFEDKTIWDDDKRATDLGGIATLGRNMRLVNKAIERGRGYMEGLEERNLVRSFVKLQRSDFVINRYTEKGDRREIARNLFMKYEEMLKEDGYSVTLRGLTEEWMDKVMERDKYAGSDGSIWERMAVGKRKEEEQEESWRTAQLKVKRHRRKRREGM